MRAILTYHSIDPSGSVISLDEETFRRHVEWLASGSVRVLSVGDLLGAPADADDAVALTFDDGFANFGSVAWPLLRDHDLPATVFVVSARVGMTNAWGGRDAVGIPTLPLLGWDALGRLHDEGVHVGSHTRTHPRLGGLPRERLEEEVLGAARDIERRLGSRPSGLAYPYGDVDLAARDVVADAYDWAVTTRFAPLDRAERPHRLPRLDAWYFRRPGLLESWGSPRFAAWVAMRGAARRARGWLEARGDAWATA